MKLTASYLQVLCLKENIKVHVKKNYSHKTWAAGILQCNYSVQKHESLKTVKCCDSKVYHLTKFYCKIKSRILKSSIVKQLQGQFSKVSEQLQLTYLSSKQICPALLSKNVSLNWKTNFKINMSSLVLSWFQRVEDLFAISVIMLSYGTCYEQVFDRIQF